MTQPSNLSESQKLQLLLLQAVVSLLLVGYWLLPDAGVYFPAWAFVGGAATCLAAMLVVFWRARALRGRFIVLFAAALVVAAAVGWHVAHT